MAPQLHGFGQAVMVIPASDYRRNKARWLVARRSGLGATDTAAILGLSSYATALDVYLEKTATGAPAETTSDQAEAGHMLEAPVARRTVREYPDLGKLVTSPGLLAHPDHPWLLATPDYGLAARGNRDAPVTELLEVKTTRENVYRKTWINDVPPARILIQCQQQLAVTGFQTCWVTCMRRDSGKMGVPYRVDRSEQVIEQIIHYAGTWWAEHVVAGVPPEPVFEDVDKLSGLYPGNDALEPLPATPELFAAITQLAAARARARVAAKDEAEAKLFIAKALSGGHTAIADEFGDVLATWKPQTVRKFDQKGFAGDYPALYEQYKIPTEQRGPLLITKED